MMNAIGNELTLLVKYREVVPPSLYLLSAEKAHAKSGFKSPRTAADSDIFID
jgi:hypothetical protein